MALALLFLAIFTTAFMKGVNNMNYEKEKEILQHNLLHFRKSLNMSAQEFGELIGVTRQTINNIESGRSNLTTPQYLAILYVLDKIIFPKLSVEQLNFMNRLLCEKVTTSNYMKSLQFKEGS